MSEGVRSLGAPSIPQVRRHFHNLQRSAPLWSPPLPTLKHPPATLQASHARLGSHCHCPSELLVVFLNKFCYCSQFSPNSGVARKRKGACQDGRRARGLPKGGFNYERRIRVRTCTVMVAISRPQRHEFDAVDTGGDPTLERAP